MNFINLDIVLMNDRAKVPTRELGSNGYDLYYAGEDSVHFNYPGCKHVLKTGIKIKLPEGYAGFIWDRSGMGAKYGIHRLAGVIDDGYVGEWLVALVSTAEDHTHTVHPGDRIAQFVVQPVPTLNFHIVDKLEETKRGENKFGASGF